MTALIESDKAMEMSVTNAITVHRPKRRRHLVSMDAIQSHWLVYVAFRGERGNCARMTAVLQPLLQPTQRCVCPRGIYCSKLNAYSEDIGTASVQVLADATPPLQVSIMKLIARNVGASAALLLGLVTSSAAFAQG